MGEYLPPSAFYTFDPIRYDLIDLIEPILSSIGGDHSEIKNIIKDSNDINNLEEGKESPFDHSTMLFLTSIDWKEGGGSPEPQIMELQETESVDFRAIREMQSSTFWSSQEKKMEK